MMSEEYFRTIVKDVLRESAREEGFQILMLGSQNRGEWEKPLKDVIDYYNLGEEGYNISFVKSLLVISLGGNSNSICG